MKEITQKLEMEEKALDNLCDEWARDHDHLIKLCEKHGFPEKEIHGDSYAAPGIQELADLLDRKLDELKKFNHQLRMMWAEDHNYIQSVCKKHGFLELEVEGDSWGVPDIQNLVELLDKRIEELTPKATSIYEEIVRDGFGGEWSKECAICHDLSMHVVRPGKVQCCNCD